MRHQRGWRHCRQVFGHQRHGSCVCPPERRAHHSRFPRSAALSARRHGINASGEITGSYFDTANKEHGFLLSHRGFVTVDYTSDGAVGTSFIGISPAGDLSGAFEDSLGNLHALLATREGFQRLTVPGAISSLAAGITATGEVVGTSKNSAGTVRGYRLSKGEYHFFIPRKHPHPSLRGQPCGSDRGLLQHCRRRRARFPLHPMSTG